MTDSPARLPITTSSPLQTSARLLFETIGFLTSFYCLIGYLPFTYRAIISEPVLPAVPRMFGWQPLVFAVGVAWLVFTERHSLRTWRWRMFVITQGAVTVWLLWARPLAQLKPGHTAALLAFGALLPVIWLFALVLRSSEERSVPRSASSFRAGETRALMVAAVAISLITSLATVGRLLLTHPETARPSLWLYLSASLLLHGAVAAGIAFLLATASLVEGRTPRGGIALRVLLAIMLTAWWFDRAILGALAFTTRLAAFYALAIAITAYLVVRALPRPAVPARSQRMVGALALLAIAALLAYIVPGWGVLYDWNLIFTKLVIVLLVWTAVLMAVRLTLRPAPARSSRTWLGPLLVLLGCAGIAIAAHARTRPAIDWYAGSDVSLRILTDLVASPASSGCDEFCGFLRQNTNITDEVSAPQLSLIGKKTAAGAKPNIFVIVIDALRKDHLGIYNPVANFTPNLDAFAGDSVVFRRAFTRYEGTSLSESAIWSGVSQLHKTFPSDFHRVNYLEQLAQREGYDAYVPWDDVVRVIAAPDFHATRLQPKIESWPEHDFCTIAGDLRAKLDTRSDPAQPVFLFTQPKNIHGARLMQIHNVRKPSGKFPSGFRPLYSSELQRLDGCFGEFIADLKHRGLYDNSIIVVTADHGEGQGEGGYYGHGITVRPYSIYVPLLVHLPAAQRALYADTNAVAFASDIAPTLYALLGYELTSHPHFGRPLFTRDKATHDAFLRPDYLIESSYYPSYAVLSDNGRFLYIDDAAKLQRFYYDLEADPRGEHDLLTSPNADPIVAAKRAFIRREVQRVADLYGYHPAGATLWNWLER